jgi:hypothetical protein
MNNFRYPKITGATERDQLQQVHSFLHQLVDQLNFAMAEVDQQATATGTAAGASAGKTQQEQQAQSTFNSIKALIIKSADIVNAYYEKISTRLEGMYVAQSDFGTYSEQTSQDIVANSNGIEQLFQNIQTIITNIDTLEQSVIETNAHINSGLLYYDDAGVPVYGLEIGQRNEIDGEEVFNKYARFTSDKLAFYDQNGNEVAYISDRKLYITHVQITGSLLQGGFKKLSLANGGTVTKWVGTGG